MVVARDMLNVFLSFFHLLDFWMRAGAERAEYSFVKRNTALYATAAARFSVTLTAHRYFARRERHDV